MPGRRGVVYEGEQRRQLDVPADVVWQWMADARRLLVLNPFHVAVEAPEPVCRAGQVVPIRHNVLGLYRRVRLARIHTYRPYVVAWGEWQPEGVDPFPHSQSFTVIPLGTQRCLVVNRLRGQLRMPGARYGVLPLYRRLAPHILATENRRLAAAVAAGVARRLDPA